MAMIFIGGGARSGKSRKGHLLALELAQGTRPVFIATAEAVDEEMTERIKKHQGDRGNDFDLVEEPKDLAKAITSVDPKATILVDCLTLWLSNNMMSGATADAQAVIDAAKSREGSTIFISNEVGEGIVPMHPVSREFRDLSGIMNQTFAAACDEVYLTTFGIAQKIK